MNKLIFIILSCILGTTNAADRIEKSFEVDGEYRLDLSNVRGSINITASSDNTVTIKADRTSGDASDILPEVSIEIDQQTKTITVSTEHDHEGSGLLDTLFNHRSQGSVDYTLTVPSIKALHIQSVSGDVEVSSVLTELSVSTVSGDTKIDAVPTIDLKSVSGDIEVSYSAQPEREQHLKTVSGEIELHLVSGTNLELIFETVSGDLTVNDRDYSETKMTTSKITLNEVGTKMQINTVSGDLIVACPSCTIKPDFIEPNRNRQKNRQTADCNHGQSSARGDRQTPLFTLGLSGGPAAAFQANTRDRLAMTSDLSIGLPRSFNSQTLLHNKLLTTGVGNSYETIGFTLLSWGYRPFSYTFSEFGLGFSYLVTDNKHLESNDRVGFATDITLGYQRHLVDFLALTTGLSYLYNRLDGDNYHYLALNLGFRLII